MQLLKTSKCNAVNYSKPKLCKHLLFAFLFTGVLQLPAQSTSAQAPAKLWHNKERELRYHPEGRDFVIQNGTRRFNRALYGTNTAFRVETGDLPEFAMYLPGMGGNLKFGIIKGDQSKWLINASSIEARYRPGTMLYKIKDALLGNGTINIQVLAGSAAENILVKVSFDHVDPSAKLFWAFGGATGKKFSRDGDIGADPESSFYLKPEYCKGNEFQFSGQQFILNFSGKSLGESARYENEQNSAGVDKSEQVTKNVLYGVYPASQQIHVADANEQGSPQALLSSKGNNNPVIAGLIDATTTTQLYWGIQNAKKLNQAEVAKLFAAAEIAREKLASRVVVTTPDPYINTYGGALSTAADGIWESPSYMHGAVAWRMRLPAWRGPYVADPLGWHDRAWSHFSSYALSQVTEPPSGPNVPDTTAHLARQQEKMGNAMFSSGYITRNPGGGKLGPHHYDMNLVYIDELLNHFKWTGDLTQVKKLWPTIQRHLAWEKRNYDADGDGLYDAYCAIWASDALQYSGGGVTHSSAYNYRSNKTAAYLAKLIGEDPKPYEKEAEHILSAINKTLWLPGSGSYAEYQDLLGMRLVHPSAGLWTVYHAIDSDVPDGLQTYEALRYVDTKIPHIPVIAKGLTGDNYLLSTTNWLPYDWSLNNVVMAENLHTALAYWQGNRQEDAYKLWKSAILESMYLGASPGNFQQISFYDAERGELYRDFGDPIGMGARSLVEGLFGIRPDLLKDTVTIKPGLPQEWAYASLSVPDIKFDFKRQGQTDNYTITPSFTKAAILKFQVAARSSVVTSVTVNGAPVKWTAVNNAVGKPVLQIVAGKQKSYRVKIVWGKAVLPNNLVNEQTIPAGNTATRGFGGAKVLQIKDPQQVLSHSSITAKGITGVVNNTLGDHTLFVKLKQGSFTWWQPVNYHVAGRLEVSDIQQDNALSFKVLNNGDQADVNIAVNPELQVGYHKTVQAGNHSPVNVDVPVASLISGSNHIHITSGAAVLDTNVVMWGVASTQKLKPETVNLLPYYNDQLTNIFKNKYLTPRPNSPTLQLPWQGIGDWAYPLAMANIDDSGIKKAAAANNGLFKIPNGVPFVTPADNSKNIVFTSQWDNFPRQVSVPLIGKAAHVYLLMAGSTNPMQSRLTNGTVTINYQDGTKTVLELRNPENWWPIEQDDDNDGFAFNTDAPKPLRVYLKSGEVTDNYTKHYGSIKGFSNRAVDGGIGTVLDLPLDKDKQLKNLELRTLANDVVIGLMSATLMRE